MRNFQERKSATKVISQIISVLLVAALLVGALAYVFKGNNLRTIKYDDTLEDGVVMVLRQENNESKEVDIKTLNVVALGEEIVVHYDGEVVLNSEDATAEDYLVIKGVKRTDSGTYIVTDNVNIEVVTAVTPSEEIQE